MMQRSKGVIGMGERGSRRVTDEETKKSESKGDIRVRKKRRSKTGIGTRESYQKS